VRGSRQLLLASVPLVFFPKTFCRHTTSFLFLPHRCGFVSVPFCSCEDSPKVRRLTSTLGPVPGLGPCLAVFGWELNHSQSDTLKVENSRNTAKQNSPPFSFIFSAFRTSGLRKSERHPRWTTFLLAGGGPAGAEFSCSRFGHAGTFFNTIPCSPISGIYLIFSPPYAPNFSFVRRVAAAGPAVRPHVFGQLKLISPFAQAFCSAGCAKISGLFPSAKHCQKSYGSATS